MNGDETKHAKALRKKRDTELIELLNEVRVALPGAQVLLAFLLVAPLNDGFDAVDDLGTALYLVSLSATVVATVLLMAPTAYHRLRWRERNKERMLRISNRLAIAGMAFLALALTAAVFVVVNVLHESVLAATFGAAAGLLFALGWFVLPLLQPYDRWDDHLDDEALDELGHDHPAPPPPE